MTTRILKLLAPLLGLTLFVLALWILHSELEKYHLDDIIHYAHGIPAGSILNAFLLTIVCYVLMTSYDFLAMRFVNRSLTMRKIATASFIGYAFSNNIGFSMLAGASVRYRLYSSWGLSGLEITKIIFFCTISLWLGFFTLCSGVFFFQPIDLNNVITLPFRTDFSLGILFLIPVVLYGILLLAWKGTVNIRGMEYSVPPFRFFLPQIFIASLDWALAGGILYLLLPPGIPFPTFIAMYLAGQLVGLASQVPGGLGVFEAVMLIFLTQYFPASIIGCLVVYRVIFYLIPLAIAAMLLAVEEILQRRHLFHMGTKAVAQWLSFIVPPVLTVITFLSGAVLLVSGATPSAAARIEWLKDLLPLAVVEFSHFLGSIVGVVLMILSRGIMRRIDSAYYLTIALLGTGAALSILKGLDYVEASILIIAMLIIIPSRPSFYRKGSLFSGRFTLPWAMSMIIVLLSTAWLTYFSYKHVEYASDLWWRFTVLKTEPRSLRAIVGATVVALTFGLLSLIHPAAHRPPIGRKEDMERAAPIIGNSPETSANLALLGDKALLFNDKGNAFIMYAIEGRSWVAMGDPVGPEDEWPEITWQFCEMSSQHDGLPVFYEIGPRNIPVYIDLGMTIIKLGEEARVNLETFSLDDRAHHDLKQSCNALTEEGYAFEIISPESVPAVADELGGISDAWLADRHAAEKGFCLGSFSEDYIRRFPVAVIRREERIVAFADIWMTKNREELSVDIMRYLPDAPSGVMDFLFAHLMQWGSQNGYHWFDLGMAPLSGLDDKPTSSLWNRIGAYMFRHAEHFDSFQDLRAYKDKFSSEWEPRYLTSMATLSLPTVLSNIASLTSRGMKGIVSK